MMAVYQLWQLASINDRRLVLFEGTDRRVFVERLIANQALKSNSKLPREADVNYGYILRPPQHDSSDTNRDERRRHAARHPRLDPTRPYVFGSIGLGLGVRLPLSRLELIVQRRGVSRATREHHTEDLGAVRLETR